jgi:histidinol dehydrogenase
MIRVLDARVHGLEAVAADLARPSTGDQAELERVVDEILEAVRTRGDAALLEFTARFDGFRAPSVAALAITPEDFRVAERGVPEAVRTALAYAAERIERYHAASVPASWRLTDEHGSVLGQEVRPLERVGIYVPGGRAAYPSTVLMSALPARVAGVGEIVLVTPPGPDGRVPAAVLAAARLAGVTEGWRLGGAQAVAALAYGTATIRRVDKVVGPGNVYVTLAKRRLFGVVGIDMLAGPSEVLVIADESADPDWVAADLLAQAEHDPRARAVLVTDAPGLVERVARAVSHRLARLARHEVAAAALAGQGALVVVASLDEAVELANRLAPEHLEVLVRDPRPLLPRLRHVGAVFVGGHTPEVVGDYVAGPSHVLPTAGTARFASPLGVEDFVKRWSVIEYSRAGFRDALPHLRVLAELEGLGGHRAAAEARAMEEGP